VQLDSPWNALLGQTTGALSTPVWLFLSLFPSGAGFVLFVYGKKQERYPQLAAGLALMIYPYFATTVTSLVGIGALIGAGLWYAIRLGW
jgi:hypothetical protein